MMDSARSRSALLLSGTFHYSLIFFLTFVFAHSPVAPDEIVPDTTPGLATTDKPVLRRHPAQRAPGLQSTHGSLMRTIQCHDNDSLLGTYEKGHALIAALPSNEFDRSAGPFFAPEPGTLMPDPARWTLPVAFAQEEDYALGFDGTNDYVKIPAASINNLSSGTIEAWVFLHDISEETILAKQHNAVNTYATLTIGYFCNSKGVLVPGEAGKLYFHAKNNVGTAGSEGFVNIGEWTHIAVVFSNTSTTFYIDGYWAGTASGNYSIPNDLKATATTLGAWLSRSYKRYLNGMLDEVRIWGTVRSEDEIRQDMQQELHGDEPGLVSYWNFNEGSGQVLYDLAPNDNHGQLGASGSSDDSDPEWIRYEGPGRATLSLQMDLDRYAEGIQSTLTVRPGETVAASLVLNGTSVYRGHTVRILVRPPEAIESATGIVFVEGVLPGSGIPYPEGSAGAWSVGSYRYVQDLVLQTAGPIVDVTEFPATVFGFDLPISPAFEGLLTLHIIRSDDPNVPTSLREDVSIQVSDDADPGQTVGVPINWQRFGLRDGMVSVVWSPPNVEVVAYIDPAFPRTLDDLQCVTELNNLGGYPNLTWSYRWFRNAEELMEPFEVNGDYFPVTGARLSHHCTTKNEAFFCVARVSDAISFLDTQTAAVTIQDTTPSAPVVQIMPQNPSPWDGLAADFVIYSRDLDPGEDIDGYEIRWYRSQDGGLTFVYKPEVSGIAPQGSWVPPAFLAEGDIWRVEATPFQEVQGTLAQSLNRIEGETGWDQVYVGENNLPQVSVDIVGASEVFALPDCTIVWRSEDLDGDAESVDLFYSEDQTRVKLLPIASGLDPCGQMVWRPPLLEDQAGTADLSRDGKIQSDDLFLLSERWRMPVRGVKYYIFARVWDSKMAKSECCSEKKVVVQESFPCECNGLFRLLRQWHQGR